MLRYLMMPILTQARMAMSCPKRSIGQLLTGSASWDNNLHKACHDSGEFLTECSTMVHERPERHLQDLGQRQRSRVPAGLALALQFRKCEENMRQRGRAVAAGRLIGGAAVLGIELRNRDQCGGRSPHIL